MGSKSHYLKLIILYVNNIVQATVYSNQNFFNRLDFRIVMVEITGRKIIENIDLKVVIYVTVFFYFYMLKLDLFISISLAWVWLDFDFFFFFAKDFFL